MNYLFKALENETRRQILEMLNKKAMAVVEIHKSFNLTEAAIAYHLDLLRNAKLINGNKIGHRVYYTVNTPVLEDAVKWINTLIKKKGH